MQIGDAPSPGFDNPIALLSDCHRRIERFLRELRAVVDRADLDAPHRAALQRALDYFAESGRRHTEDEEKSLFPRLRSYNDTAVLGRLEHDHAAADEAHAGVDALGRRWLAEGALDQAAMAELDRLLGWLEQCYETHIKLEDEVLFPLAATTLPAHELQAVGYEMAARRGLSPRPTWLDELREEHP